MNRLALALILIAVLLAAWFAPAALLSWRLQDGLRRDLRAERVTVRVAGGPLGIAQGRLARLSLDARGAALDTMPLDEVSIELRGVRLDPQEAFRGNLVVRETAGGTAMVVVREESLSGHLARTRGLRDARVRLDDGEVTITGQVVIVDVPVDVVVHARLVVADATHLALLVQGLRVSGFEVSADVSSAVALSINPLLTAPQQPVPLRFVGVTVDDGAARIAAEVVR